MGYYKLTLIFSFIFFFFFFFFPFCMTSFIISIFFVPFPLSPSLYSIPRFYSVAIPCILQPRHSSSTSSAPYAPNQNLLLLHGFLRSASLSATSIHALFRFFPHLFSYWNLVPHLWFSSNIYFLCVFSPFQLTSFIGSLSIFPFFWFTVAVQNFPLV